VGPWSQRWLDEKDDRVVVALLHSRCLFIGELLAEAAVPRTTDELQSIAGGRYGLSWESQTQITNRRGWLQSAGMMAVTESGKLQTTAEGKALVELLDLRQPSEVAASPASPVVAAEPTAAEGSGGASEIAPPPAVRGVVSEALAAELLEASTDAHDPDRFERAIRDAFDFLGFRAEWLGRSGRTDVLADALIGQDRYRVIVDAKTSGSGSVSDQQIDWVTLDEHKAKHDADYVAVVAPNPSGRRVSQRSGEFLVTVISAEQLALLCRRHERAPLGLDEYRSLFTTGGLLDAQAADEAADELERRVGLVAAALSAIRDHSEAFGRLTARDLFLIIAGDPVATGTSEAELQELLGTLASPLLGILVGEPAGGYRLATSPAVSRLRLEVLGRAIGGLEQR
jgi:hypothetical protein